MMKTFADVVGACGFHGGVKENLFSIVTIAMLRRMRTNDE
jgi:lactam utilization protein B